MIGNNLDYSFPVIHVCCCLTKTLAIMWPKRLREQRSYVFTTFPLRFLSDSNIWPIMINPLINLSGHRIWHWFYLYQVTTNLFCYLWTTTWWNGCKTLNWRHGSHGSWIHIAHVIDDAMYGVAMLLWCESKLIRVSHQHTYIEFTHHIVICIWYTCSSDQCAIAIIHHQCVPHLRTSTMMDVLVPVPYLIIYSVLFVS